MTSILVAPRRIRGDWLLRRKVVSANGQRKLTGSTCLHDRLLSVEDVSMSRDKWEKLGKIFALQSIRRGEREVPYPLWGGRLREQHGDGTVAEEKQPQQ